MKREEPNPASAKEPAEGSRENVNAGPNDRTPAINPHRSKDFDSKSHLPGKTDSGPEPDVHGRELPPQE